MTRRWPEFRTTVLALFAVAIAVRIGFALGLGRPITGGDAAEFREVARHLANGNGYSLEFHGQGLLATAQHPPVFPGLLALLDVVGLGSLVAQRVVVSIVAACAVPLMAVLGRRLGGPFLGIGAALVATLHPLWVQPAGVVMSESTYLVMVPLVLLVALRCLDGADTRWYLLLGLVLGAAILNRSEAVALIVLLCVPVIFLGRSSMRPRGVAAAAVLVGLAVTVGPWLIRNSEAVGAAKLSTNTGNTFIGAYCPETMRHGPYFGAYYVACPFGFTAALLEAPPPGGASAWTPSSLDDELTSEAFDQAFSKPVVLPVLAVVHVLRMWGVWDIPFQMEYDVREGRDAVLQRVGGGLHLALLLLALVWLLEMPTDQRRRWIVVLAPVLLVTLTGAVLYGSTRLRVAAEPSIALAAVAGLGVIRDRWRTRREGVPVGEDAPGADPPVAEVDSAP